LFNANVIIFFVVYFCEIWAFSSSRKRLLITLLRLEFVVLVLYFYIYFYLCNFNYSLFFVVYFLVFSVCEGSLGLSILVSMIRSHGNEPEEAKSATSVTLLAYGTWSPGLASLPILTRDTTPTLPSRRSHNISVITLPFPPHTQMQMSKFQPKRVPRSVYSLFCMLKQ
jgi:NADH-ubiquinone oxidoreductase chain 4L